MPDHGPLCKIGRLVKAHLSKPWSFSAWSGPSPKGSVFSVEFNTENYISKFSVGTSLTRCWNKDSKREGLWFIKGFSGGSNGKESDCSVWQLGSIPGSGRSPGEGNGYPLQYSCLENAVDRRAWWAIVHGVAKSQTWLKDKMFSSINVLAYVQI